jgi:tRNA G10  N-methylase Trm11
MMRLLAVGLLSISLFAQTPMRLAEVRKIYIEKMPGNLDQYLRSSILKTFRDRVTIVLEKSMADAILSESPLGAQSTKATVNLTDKHGNIALWSGTAGDREEKFLWLKHGGEQKVADRLADQLKDAMEH